MTTFVYIIWFLIPLGLAFMALWSKLENVSTKGRKKSDAAFLIKQALFVLGCSLLCVLLDMKVLPQALKPVLPSFIPYGVVQILLLPIVLLVGAKLVGGSKPIKISKAPRPQSRRKRS